MDFRAVIFDLDGTLLNTIDDLADSMNIVLEGLGFPSHGVEKYKYYIGDGLYNLVSRAIPRDSHDEDLIWRCIDRFRQEYNRRWGNKTRPYNGIPQLLDGLKDRSVPMAVLSNKPHEFTKIIVDKFFPQWHFSAVFGERKGIPKKPDPTSAWEICRILGMQPEEFLYIGDTNTDMKTARASNMYAVGALWGFRDADELLESGAQTLVERPVDVLRLL
ncbi:MAG: HAD family hydrolase [Mahellales bacterium]|jgi:phosphoglycolate phosphatase